MEPLGAGDPRTVGPYRLTGRLGSGGMGRVFLGTSPTGRRVAVKLVREDLASAPGFRERFRREAKLAMRAGGFWSAEVVDADPDAATPWIASQYVDGPSLSQRVSQNGPLGEREVFVLGSGLAEALAAFHKTGLVHRDLKPSNILLVDDGPRVIDFGISKAVETSETAGSTDLTRAGTILGTPGFMSPEQARGQPAGPPSDVFSLGALLVYAATGTGPFGDGPSHALLFRVVYEEAELGRLPYGLRELTHDCLRKTPEERPTAEQLVTRLSRSPQAGVPDPRAVPAGHGHGQGTDTGTGPGMNGDAPAGPPGGVAETGPLPERAVNAEAQRGSSGEAATAAMGPAPGHSPLDAPLGEPAESPSAGGFGVEQRGPEAFRRRMRRPVGWTLGAAFALLLLGLSNGNPAPMAVIATAVTLLGLAYALKVSLPLLVARAVHVGAAGLTLRHGRRTLTVPWRDVASVEFDEEKGKRRFSVKATLKPEADAGLPGPFRAGKGVLKCTIASALQQDTRTRVDSLETALRDFAGSRYQPR